MNSAIIHSHTHSKLVPGYFPSPIYIGAIINSTCILWQYSCGDQGACWLYDIVSYRHAFFGTLLGLRCCSIICYVIMIWFLRDDYKDDIPVSTTPGFLTLRRQPFLHVYFYHHLFVCFNLYRSEK